MPRPTASIVLYLCLVFLSGVLVGGFGYSFLNRRSGPPRGGDPRARYEEELRTHLKLRPDQAQKLHAILENTGTRFRQVRERVKPELEAIQKEQIESINGILDDQQRKDYEKMRADRDAQRRRAGRPAPGPPGH